MLRPKYPLLMKRRGAILLDHVSGVLIIFPVVKLEKVDLDTN